MNISGILVVVPTIDVATSIEALSALPGVDVHHVDKKTGRIIVTQEAVSISEEIACLKKLKALPQVVLAEMVYHHFEDDREIIDGIPAELDHETLGVIPSLLED
jgi:nitrate reductase NapD